MVTEGVCAIKEEFLFVNIGEISACLCNNFEHLEE